LVTSSLTCSRPDVVVFCPQGSLATQLAAWGGRHARYRIEQLFAKDMAGVCKGLRGAPVAVVDMTDNPGQTAEAFSQIVRRLGSSAVVAYTERLHDGLEFFVRGCGVVLLWGPLSDVQWDDLLQRMLASTARHRSFKALAGALPDWPLRTTADLEFERLRKQQFSAGVHRPKTGVK
jgi:hypothetical protein